MKIIFNVYRLINVILLIIVYTVTQYASSYFNNDYCVDNNCSLELTRGALKPIIAGGEVLIYILIGMLLVPKIILRRWLFYVAPPVCIFSYWMVSRVSIYDGGIMIPNKTQMAVNMMSIFAVITILFVLGHLLFDWYKKGKQTKVNKK